MHISGHKLYTMSSSYVNVEIQCFNFNCITHSAMHADILLKQTNAENFVAIYNNNITLNAMRNFEKVGRFCICPILQLYALSIVFWCILLCACVLHAFS